ncbi:NYN domain-containing protein [Candidatus Kaiserbacteria bacterium]|nr:NYN domain-containing protein [Candidatus Kaiserbacteria bacterium]
MFELFSVDLLFGRSCLPTLRLQDEYDRAALLTSDGDFASLVRYLREIGKTYSRQPAVT